MSHHAFMPIFPYGDLAFGNDVMYAMYLQLLSFEYGYSVLQSSQFYSTVFVKADNQLTCHSLIAVGCAATT